MSILLWLELLAGCTLKSEDGRQPEPRDPANARSTAKTAVANVRRREGPLSVAPDKYRNSAGLCAEGEVVIFECRDGSAVISVCGITSGAKKTAQYRYGTAGKIAFVYPGTSQDPRAISWARTGYSGGGELQLNFSNDGFDYTVYSRVVRTGFGADGHFDPDFQAGVLVHKAGRLLSKKTCDRGHEAMLNTADPADYMSEGNFIQLDD